MLNIFFTIIRMAKTRKNKSKKSYDIHDNGGRPFTVEVGGNKLTIFVNEYDPVADVRKPPRQFKTYTFRDIWIGDDPIHYMRKELGWKPKWKGNTVLAQIGAERYLYIGSEIFEFDLADGDEPVLYESYVGPNDVPYPYLVGKTHTYLLIEGVKVENKALKLKEEAYSQYYGHVKTAVPVADFASKLKKKVVHKRL